MFIIDLLATYAAWLFAAAMFFWLGSVLYRTTRNTLNAYTTETATDAEPPAAVIVHIPSRPARKPRVPLTNAA